MQKITPFLWFNDNAEAALKFYTSVFRHGKVIEERRHYDGSKPDGRFVSAVFELEGQRFMAINGGPQFTFTPAISFFVSCESQGEVDSLYHKLAEGGEQQRCGWVKDRFGISWQIIPTSLSRLLSDDDPKKSKRVMDAMLSMNKIDMDKLQKAYDGLEVQNDMK